MTTRSVSVCAAAGAIALWSMAGCAGGGKQHAGASKPGPADAATLKLGEGLAISIDGSMRDWPDDVAAVADGRYLYLRFAPGLDHPIQNAPLTTLVLVDADGNTETGASDDGPHTAGLGIDLEIRFSPHEGEDAGRGGVEVWLHGPEGMTQIGHDGVGLLQAPTVAAEWYELRLDRAVVAGIVPGGLWQSIEASAVFALAEPTGDGGVSLVGWSDPVSAVMPAASAWAGASATIPAKPEGAVRIVSWNVLRGAPMKETGGFAGVLDVLAPDIVLVQEWDGADDETLAGWFNALVPGPGRWNARTGAGWGVGVISRHPMSPMGPVRLEEPGREGAVRYLGALIDTPGGRVAAASVHFKCCGTAGSDEDRRRMVQAGLSRERLTQDGAAADIAVIGGDLNLVGSREPLRVMIDGGDFDGSDLAVAQPGVLGDRSNYTWRAPGSRFGPGRLDYIAYSDATAELVNAFILDLDRLDDGSLAAAGLYRADTEGSDHLPVVIDLRPR